MHEFLSSTLPAQSHTNWQREAKGRMPTIELAASHGRNPQGQDDVFANIRSQMSRYSAQIAQLDLRPQQENWIRNASYL